jgi:hypothetical protein
MKDDFLSRDEIYNGLGKDISIDRVSTELTDLVALRLLEHTKVSTGNAGRQAYKFKLREDLAQQLDRIM